MFIRNVLLSLTGVLLLLTQLSAAAADEEQHPSDIDRFQAYQPNKSLPAVTLKWPVPPTQYSLDPMWAMVARQRETIHSAWQQVGVRCLNPGMIRDPRNDEHIIMIWRSIKARYLDHVGYNIISATTFKHVKRPDFVEEVTSDFEHREYVNGEDVRVFCFHNAVYLFFNLNVGRMRELRIARVRYHTEKDMMYVLKPIAHVRYEREVQVKHEKNWTPFEFCPLSLAACRLARYTSNCLFAEKDKTKMNAFNFTLHDNTLQDMHELLDSPSTLLFIYSIQPHRIVMLSREISMHSVNSSREQSHRNTLTMHAQTVFLTDIDNEDDWRWGEMRGGSPAVALNDKHYITFFHSRGQINGHKIGTYVMGAYLFQREPPFAITHITKEPIMHETFVNESVSGWTYKSVDYVQFPIGVVLEDEHILVSYGRNDRDGWILKLNKHAFLADLKPVRGSVIGVSDVDSEGKIVENSYRVVKKI